LLCEHLRVQKVADARLRFHTGIVRIDHALPDASAVRPEALVVHQRERPDGARIDGMSGSVPEKCETTSLLKVGALGGT